MKRIDNRNNGLGYSHLIFVWLLRGKQNCTLNLASIYGILAQEVADEYALPSETVEESMQFEQGIK